MPGRNQQLHAQAENVVLCHCQQSTFPDEFNKLKRNDIIPVSSNILLNLFLDRDEDLIRAQGRCANADISDDMKRPFMLPANYCATGANHGNGHI